MLKSGEIAFDKPELGAFQMMLATADKVASSIASLTWLLLEAKEDEFVTCDRGLAMHDPTPKFPWSGHALRSSPKAQTSYPLTPQYCLVLVELPHPVAVAEADAEDVREFNLRTYGWASQYIYGRTQEVVQRVRTQAKDKPALVVRPRTPKPVILEEVDPNDTEVGEEHAKKGWPRTVAITDDDGNERTASYQLIAPNDQKSDPASLRRRAGEAGPRHLDGHSPRGRQAPRGRLRLASERWLGSSDWRLVTGPLQHARRQLPPSSSITAAHAHGGALRNRRQSGSATHLCRRPCSSEAEFRRCQRERAMALSSTKRLRISS